MGQADAISGKPKTPSAAKPVPKDTAESEVRHIPVGGSVTVSELTKDSLHPELDTVQQLVKEMPQQGPDKVAPQPEPVPQPKPISQEEATLALHRTLLTFLRSMGLNYIR